MPADDTQYPTPPPDHDVHRDVERDPSQKAVYDHLGQELGTGDRVTKAGSDAIGTVLYVGFGRCSVDWGHGTGGHLPDVNPGSLEIVSSDNL